MKKLVGIFALIMCAGMAFAQNAKYTELLNKAKDYEAKKQYAYALGYYYDAIEADLDNCEEAYEGWERLSEAIKNGKPGLDEYDEFSIYDGWIALLQNSEKYCTEHAAEIFNFDIKLKKGEVDYETKTATYTVSVTENYGYTYSLYDVAKAKKNYFYEVSNKRVIKALSDKYNRLFDCLFYGLAASSKDDWKRIPSDWPLTSIFTTADTYEKTGAATYTGYSLGDEIGKACLWESCEPAWLVSIRVGYWYPSYSGWGKTHYYYSPYLINFSILDTNGNILLKDSLTRSREFKKIPASTMSILDSGKYKIRIDGIDLFYGKIANNDAELNTRILNQKIKSKDEINYERDMAFLKNLKKVKLNPNEFSFNNEKISNIDLLNVLKYLKSNNGIKDRYDIGEILVTSRVDEMNIIIEKLISLGKVKSQGNYIFLTEIDKPDEEVKIEILKYISENENNKRMCEFDEIYYNAKFKIRDRETIFGWLKEFKEQGSIEVHGGGLDSPFVYVITKKGKAKLNQQLNKESEEPSKKKNKNKKK